MTICYSVKKNGFIMAATDVLAEDPLSHNTYVEKKFILNGQRNYVLLISGGWEIDNGPDPRFILVQGLGRVVKLTDTIQTIAGKVLQVLSTTYNDNGKVKLQVQVCGFDGDAPHTFVVFSDKKSVEEVADCITGAADIMSYGRSPDGVKGTKIINALPPVPQLVETSLRRFMDLAIAYENNCAKARGAKPTTGLGVNVVTIYPNRSVWSMPRADSKNDILKTNCPYR